MMANDVIPTDIEDVEDVELDETSTPDDREYVDHKRLAREASAYVETLDAVANVGSIEDLDVDADRYAIDRLIEDDRGRYFNIETDETIDPEDRGDVDDDLIGVEWNDPHTDWVDLLNDWALDVWSTATIRRGDIDIESVTILWGTGGPHYETTIDADGRALSVAYGWFGANRAEDVTRSEYLFDTLAELDRE